MKKVTTLFILSALLGLVQPLWAQQATKFVEVGFGSEMKRYELKGEEIYEVTEEGDAPSYLKIGSGYSDIEVSTKYHNLIATKSSNSHKYAYIDGAWSEHLDNLDCNHKEYTLSPSGGIFEVNEDGTKASIYSGSADEIRCIGGNLVRYSGETSAIYRPNQSSTWVASSNTFTLDSRGVKNTYIVKSSEHKLDVISGGEESTIKQNVSYAYKDPIFERVVAISNDANHTAETLIKDNWVATIQEIHVQGHEFEVTADRKLKIDGNTTSIENVDIIREENSNIVLHDLDGKKWLYYDPSSEWIEISQIISVQPSGKTYFIKESDGSVWETYRSGESRQISQLGGMRYLRDNDGDLIAVTGAHYWKWKPKAIDEGEWEEITPKFLPARLTMNQEGIWFFIQHKQRVMERVALGVDKDGSVELKNIPEVGSCAPFLWRIDKSAGTTVLINKAYPDKKLAWKGDKLNIADEGTDWILDEAGATKWGTNAYLMKSGDKLLKSDKNGQLTLTDDVVWLFQPDRLVSGYFLARNDETNTNQVFDRKLIGLNGSMYYGTNATSDWALMNTQLIINNLMNTLLETNKVQSYLQNPRITIFCKDDTNKKAADYPYLKYIYRGDASHMGKFRGSVTWDADLTNGIDILATVTEEMMCKTGVTNRPDDTGYREFEQVIHEFTHPLMMKMGWAGRGRPIETSGILNPPDAHKSSENFCWDVQAWFNNVHSAGYETYPQGNRVIRWRTQEPTDSKMGTQNMLRFMGTCFNSNNTWMPPGNLRPKNYVEDKEGNRYPIVELNGQLWMAENLRATDTNTGCADRNDKEECRKYGFLYHYPNRNTLCGKLGLGWRLPTREEWNAISTTYEKELLPSGESGFNTQFSGNGNASKHQIFGKDQNGVFLYDSSGSVSESPSFSVSNTGRGSFLIGSGSNFWYSCRCVKDN